MLCLLCIFIFYIIRMNSTTYNVEMLYTIFGKVYMITYLLINLLLLLFEKHLCFLNAYFNKTEYFFRRDTSRRTYTNDCGDAQKKTTSICNSNIHNTSNPNCELVPNTWIGIRMELRSVCGNGGQFPETTQIQYSLPVQCVSNWEFNMVSTTTPKASLLSIAERVHRTTACHNVYKTSFLNFILKWGNWKCIWFWAVNGNCVLRLGQTYWLVHIFKLH